MVACSPCSNLAPVVIDGCAVPRIIYDRVKCEAVRSGKTRFIGVRYDQPAELRPASDERPWNWEKIFHRDALRRAHMVLGEHLVYLVDMTRDELQRESDLIMILWIGPRPD